MMTDSEIDKNKRKRSERRKKGQCQLGHAGSQPGTADKRVLQKKYKKIRNKCKQKKKK